MAMQKFNFSCSDCKTKTEINAPTQQSAIDTVRFYKWSVSRDRKVFYCPNCAPLHRSVGCNGGKRTGIQQSFYIPTNG